MVTLVLGAVLGQPVLFSFVETGSMEPALEPGDGFVAIPTPVGGDIQEGDVIVFDAEQLQGGGLTTHRVVGESETGYITKGDANPFTDQDSQEPPISEGQIVAKAWQVNGNVIVIPRLGTAVETVRGGIEAVQRTIAGTLGTTALLGAQGLALLIAGIGLVILLVGMLLDDDRRRRAVSRTQRRTGVYGTRRLILAMAVFVALVSGGTMAAMSGTHEYGMVSASFESGDPMTVPVGETGNVTHPALNGGELPVYAFYAPASDHVSMNTDSVRMAGDEQRNITVTLQAPPETGFYPQYVSEYRYFAILPLSVVTWLYGIHPWLPLVVTSGLMGGIFLVPAVFVAGRSSIRTRSRSRGGLWS